MSRLSEEDVEKLMAWLRSDSLDWDAIERAQKESTPGTWEAIAAGLDGYHAVNLLEALKLVPDTGDWHGSLRISCEMLLDREREAGRTYTPNATAQQQIEMGVYPRRDIV